MPRVVSALELAALPSILLLGARKSGKSQTLASWSMMFRLYERNDAGELIPVVKRKKEEIRTYAVAQYVVEFDRSLFRVFDVPGEVLEATAGAELILGQLLTFSPSVAGVIAFAVPPREGDDEVGCINDPEQLHIDQGQELGEFQVVEQLRGVFELVQGFVRQRLRQSDAADPAIVVQIGFADLVAWRDDDMGRLCSLHNELRPGISSAMTRHAWRSRASVFSGLDAVARSTFGWLARLRRAVPGIAFLCVPVSNEAGRQPNMPAHNVGASLLCVVDQIAGPRIRAEWERRRVTVAGLALVAVLALAVGSYAAIARWSPGSLPSPLAVSACTNVSQPEERCACVDALARNATHLPFSTRLELISPFVAACWQDMLNVEPPGRPQQMSLAVQVELARGAVAPADFNAARYEAALQAGGRPGEFAGPMPWFPAGSEGQQKALQAVQALMEGTPAPEAARLTEGLTPVERTEFGALLRLLGRAKATSACLNEWQQARASDNWKPLATHCGREGQRLPAELRPCYRADAALGFPESVPKPVTSPCATEDACSHGKGLEARLLRAPRPDHHTFANMAARAETPEELAQCVGRANNANPAHLLLLRLLGPGTFEDRLNVVRSAGDEPWPAVSEFVSREWVAAESGRKLGAPKGRAASRRLPMLPLKHAVDAACALVDAPAMYGPPATPIPWREAMETEPLSAATSATHKARAALALLTAAGDGRTPQSAGCELSAAVALLRLPAGPDHAALLARLNAAFQVFESARDLPDFAATQAAASKLRCRLGPGFAPSARVAAEYAATYGCAAASEASAAPAANPVATR